jgi:integrase
MSGTLKELPPTKADKKDKTKRWELRVFVGRDPERAVRDEDGRIIKQAPPIHASKVFHGGKREAQKALDDFVAETGGTRTVGSGATVGKLLDDWLRDLERQGKARSTLETYEIHVRRHIRPALGAIRLDRLSATDVNHYLGQLADKGLKPRTIQLNHSILRAALSHGVEVGWLKNNVAKGRKTAKPARSDNAFTTEHLRKLYRAVADEDSDMAALIALAAITGCRRGELLGLRWDDFDSDRAALRVERAWVPGDGGQHLVDGTKSGDGRTVFIGADGVTLVEQYREAKTEQLGRTPDGWLLSNDGGATPLRAKSVTEYVSRTAKRLGIPAHLHTLRHWNRTEMGAQGVDLATAAAQGGHSIGVMAETYLHTTDDRGAKAGELVAAVVGQAIALPAKTE